MTLPKTITLSEYDSVTLGKEDLDIDTAKLLHQKYGARISIKPPTFTNDNHWELVSQGWVGHIPLTESIHFALTPKVPISNLFRMLEYAYRLKSFEFLTDLYKSEQLIDSYQRLAHILARKILDRNRRGLYKEYVAQDDNLYAVRGRINIADTLHKPWDIRHQCHYHEHSADLDDNQILLWTLHIILKTGLCSNPETLATIRKAYRELINKVGLQEYAPTAAIGRIYNRLNSEYKPMHVLCRFFLENTGPSHEIGDRNALPFLVDMARLFELFVYEWMSKHLHDHFPTSYRVDFQQKINVGAQGHLHFDVDLIIEDRSTGTTKCVLDTKYKDTDSPSASDVAQVVAYATGKQCANAILVYPNHINYIGGRIGISDTIVATAAFPLDKDIDEAGHSFLNHIKTIIA